MANNSFDAEIFDFSKRVKALKESLPFVKVFMQFYAEQTKKAYKAFLMKHNIEEGEIINSIIKLKHEEINIFREIIKALNNANITNSVLPRSFIVSLVSVFDAYIGRLINVMFCEKSELFKTLEKTISCSQIHEFSSINQIKEYIIENEIENVLRESHDKQIGWLERKLNCPLRNLDAWKYFIEVTERRNLFVHCDGIVSSQYISVCKKHGVGIGKDVKVGKTLLVSQEYFTKACEYMLEMGVKLGHVIWRRLLPNSLKDADSNLNNICYEMIRDEEYGMAITLLEFATSVIKEWYSQESKLMFIINKAQAYKWLGNQKKSKEILHEVDWSACADKFKLANYVITDDYENAKVIMERINLSGEVTEENYKEWPLFKEFVKTEIFNKTYKKIYGEEFHEEIEEVAATKNDG
ncbi:MAG: hypothetical protein AB1500_03750 [Bacillota bacterium]